MSGRGRLVLKGRGAVYSLSGGARPAPKPGVSRAPAGAAAIAAAASELFAPPAAAPVPEEEAVVVRVPGIGTLITSSTSVRGFNTRFSSQVRAGDVLEVAGDARPVQFIVSDTSLSLREAFTRDTGREEPFTVASSSVRAGEVVLSPAAAAAAAAAKRAAELAAATGASTDRIAVKREGAAGSGAKSYTTVAVSGGASMSREALLDLRAKARGDRFC